jgi:hypothetical protein
MLRIVRPSIEADGLILRQCDKLCILLFFICTIHSSNLRPYLLCFGSMQVCSHTLPVVLTRSSALLFFRSTRQASPHEEGCQNPAKVPQNHVHGTPSELPHKWLDHGYPRQRYLDPGCNVHRSHTQVATHKHTPNIGFSVGVPRLNSPVLEPRTLAVIYVAPGRGYLDYTHQGSIEGYRVRACASFGRMPVGSMVGCC